MRNSNAKHVGSCIRSESLLPPHLHVSSLLSPVCPIHPSRFPPSATNLFSSPPSSDDPWNQTAADNAEWLRRFKRDVGILTDASLPGLPECTQWSAAQGGSGFEPPYLFPNPSAQVTTVEADIPIKMKEAKRMFVAERQTANKYVRGFKTRWQRPAVVFCSRELEKGLVEFVTSRVMGNSDGGGGGGGGGEIRGMFPSDEAIRVKAREIQKMNTTSADDAVLLEKFKTMMRERLGLTSALGSASASLGSAQDFSGMGGSGMGMGLIQSSSVDTSVVPSPTTAARFSTGTTTSPDLRMGMDFSMDLGLNMGGISSSMSNMGTMDMANLTDWSSSSLNMMGLGTSMADSCTNMDMGMGMGMNLDMPSTTMSTSMPTNTHMGLLGVTGGAAAVGGGGQDMMMLFKENSYEMDDLLQAQSSFGFFSNNDDDLAVMGGIGQL